MLQNCGEMTPREAAESSLPFNYAPQTPRERIEQDWEVRLTVAASPTGYVPGPVGLHPGGLRAEPVPAQRRSCRSWKSGCLAARMSCSSARSSRTSTRT